jgi:putative acetyltransferase
MSSDETGVSKTQHLNISASFSIQPMRTAEDAAAFRRLNEEWIMGFFTLEGNDEKILGDPVGEIIARGGEVFMAHLNGTAVGCVALVYVSDELVSLAKMAVAPEVQGRGIGRALLEYALVQAKRMGAITVALGSNTELKSAVHLYESLGFEHLPVEQWPEFRYARGNVFMRLTIR